MSTVVDFAALQAPGGPKVTLLDARIFDTPAAVTGAGGEFTDFGDFTAVYLEAVVKLRNRSRDVPSLALTIEHSDDGVSWATAQTFAFISDGNSAALLDSPKTHLRATWVAGGGKWDATVTAAPQYLDERTGGGSAALDDVLALGNNAGGLAIENLADGVNPSDAATVGQIGGSQGLDDVLGVSADAGGIAITNLANGVNPSDAATVAQIVAGGAGVADVITVDPDAAGLVIENLAVNTALKTADYNIADNDDVIQVDNSSAHCRSTLPTAAGRAGKTYTITKVNSYTPAYLCNVLCTGGETISGIAVRTLAGAGESLKVVSDGANWQIVGGSQDQYSTPQEWYVGGPVYAGATGKTRRTAFHTFAAAMAVASGGDTIYICGEGIVEDIVIDQAIRVVGLGNKPYIGGVENLITSAVVTIDHVPVTLENLRISGGVNHIGTMLLLDGATNSSVTNVFIDNPSGTPTAYPTSPYGSTGIGGCGLVVNNSEGCKFKDLHISLCSIGVVVGHEASTNEMDGLTISGCYQDIVAGLKTGTDAGGTPLDVAPWNYGGGNGGGWTWINVKDVSPVVAVDRPHDDWVVDFIGDGTANYIGASNGANTFIDIDLSESAYEAHARFGSVGNTFIRGVSAPATVWHIDGQRNTFIRTRILGAGMIVDGDYQTFIDVLSGGTIAGSGSHLEFQGACTWMSSTTIPLALTGTDNVFGSRMQFDSAGGGQPYPVVGDLGSRAKFDRSEGVAALTYGATVATDVRLGTYFTLAVTDGSALTISNPTDSANADPTSIMVTKQITYDILNSSGGMMGEITWGSHFKLSAFTNPANGKRRTITFQIVDATTHVEVGRSPADI